MAVSTWVLRGCPGLVHRRFPGMLHLKAVRLPPALAAAADRLLLLRGSSVQNMQSKAKALTNYLWSRKRPPEAGDLRRKARQLERQLREEMVQTSSSDTPALLNVADEQKLQNKILAMLRKTTYHWEAVRAAHSFWGESLNEYVCVDSSASMLSVAEQLLQGDSDSQTPHFSTVYFRQFLPVSPKVKFNLVVSAFSLNELPSLAERMETIQTLWRKTDDFLVLVENGTKEGHQMLMEAREVVLKGGDKLVHDPREAQVFAPCPHHLPCPRLSSQKPLSCNFIQAYHPLPFSKNPEVQEERFFFLILRRGSGETEEPWPRIIQRVLPLSRHVHCHLCCADGTVQHAVITARRHGRDLYRCVRCSHWGDRLPVVNVPEEISPSSGDNGSAQTEDQS
ncbi:methyltransferase-like protein 17, mitochondrial isoform X2 [Alligator mississippiensis]|uniref:methyltransferase-like protein 17, mitochondrial isoform X2 n=1 Tax=Alligator mississippiensis TaxID=8496 RepID=UPI0028774758|nr:methyltransferase-like protein 17, mitochondrial isoform X2 [Alligator mississippiensis]